MTARSLARPLASQLAKPLTVAGSSGGGFDYVPSALAAYSVKKLRSAAANCFRVRESSGNTESDISFSGSAFDSTSLGTFVGANSGYLTKWYDQTANGKDVLQATTTLQSRIVNAGSIGTGATFDGTDDAFALATKLTSGTITALTVIAKIVVPALNGSYQVIASEAATASYGWAIAVDPARKLALAYSDDGTTGGAHIYVGATNAALTQGATTTVAFTYAAGTILMYVGGSSVAFTGSISPPTNIFNSSEVFRIGRTSQGVSSAWFVGEIQSVVVFQSVLTPSEIATLSAQL